MRLTLIESPTRSNDSHPIRKLAAPAKPPNNPYFDFHHILLRLSPPPSPPPCVRPRPPQRSGWVGGPPPPEPRPPIHGNPRCGHRYAAAPVRGSCHWTLMEANRPTVAPLGVVFHHSNFNPFLHSIYGFPSQAPPTSSPRMSLTAAVASVLAPPPLLVSAAQARHPQVASSGVGPAAAPCAGLGGAHRRSFPHQGLTMKTTKQPVA